VPGRAGDGARVGVDGEVLLTQAAVGARGSPGPGRARRRQARSAPPRAGPLPYASACARLSPASDQRASHRASHGQLKPAAHRWPASASAAVTASIGLRTPVTNQADRLPRGSGVEHRRGINDLLRGSGQHLQLLARPQRVLKRRPLLLMQQQPRSVLRPRRRMPTRPILQQNAPWPTTTARRGLTHPLRSTFLEQVYLAYAKATASQSSLRDVRRARTCSPRAFHGDVHDGSSWRGKILLPLVGGLVVNWDRAPYSLCCDAHVGW
jgi:hypothetical protein